MVKLIVVAGSSSQKLAEFFEKRGTFEIVAVYDNLTNNVNQIQNKVIIADKLLYLYNDAEEYNMNIKSDMQILNNLLMKDSFFKPGEIVFMTTASPLAKQATKFFVTIMEDCNKSDYSIKTVEDKMSFVSIYNLLMGTTNTLDFKNVRKNLYKVERDTEEKEEYIPEDDRNLLIEPFGMESVISYRDKQKAVKKADTGTVYSDNDITEFSQSTPVQLDTINVESIVDKTKYILVSGLTKSGKSVWASQLAVAASKCSRSVCVLDFTENADILRLLYKSSATISDVSLLQVLRQQFKTQTITYASPGNDAEASVVWDFLRLFNNQKVAVFDVVFIVCEIDQILPIRRIFINPIDIVTTVNATMDDLNITCKYLPDLDDADNKITIILNRIVALDDDYLDAVDVRSILPESMRVVKDKVFTNFDSKGQLYLALFGDK